MSGLWYFISKLWYYSQVQSDTWTMIFHFRGNSHMELLLVLSSWTSNTVTFFPGRLSRWSQGSLPGLLSGPKAFRLNSSWSGQGTLLWWISSLGYYSPWRPTTSLRSTVHQRVSNYSQLSRRSFGICTFSFQWFFGPQIKPKVWNDTYGMQLISPRAFVAQILAKALFHSLIFRTSALIFFFWTLKGLFVDNHWTNKIYEKCDLISTSFKIETVSSFLKVILSH